MKQSSGQVLWAFGFAGLGFLGLRLLAPPPRVVLRLFRDNQRGGARRSTRTRSCCQAV
jgi:hypothetical protein